MNKRKDLHTKPLLGFIGQGWIGKNYADHYEDKGYPVVRYALEEAYRKNKEQIRKCDIVFVAVPTPTTPKGFDASAVEDALSLVGDGKIAIIKSTVKIGTTRRLAREFPNIKIVHMPEFLREAYARHDVDNPERMFVGIPEETREYHEIAKRILSLGPRAAHEKICRAEEAEMLKYTHNALGYATIVFSNLLYDLAQKHDIPWKSVRQAILDNPWFPSRYIDPVHKGGRGAGGDCFIKDFAAFALMYKEANPDDIDGEKLLEAFSKKNNRLLRDSGKDIARLNDVYGE